MKIAYADPPYLGLAEFYEHRHPGAMEWNDVETHRRLIERLCREFPDGWAMSLHTPSLQRILPLCPQNVRVAAWVKPFAAFKLNVKPAYAWEPVIYLGGRNVGRNGPTPRDWVAASASLRGKEFIGAKPRNFARWLFELLRMLPGDEFIDLFPGTGGMTEAWKEWSGDHGAQKSWDEMWSQPLEHCSPSSTRREP